MAEILLSTLNARYLHPALGLRALLANLGELAPRAALREFTLEHRPADVAEKLLAERPRLIGLGIYVWNATQMNHLVALLKAVAPDVVVVVGGPEISHEVDAQPVAQLADVVITGEAEVAFREVCIEVLAGRIPPKLVHASAPDLASIATPHGLYDDDDIAHRTMYVETSRGCPYRCAFCLSSLDERVRRFPRDRVLEDLRGLLDRGVTHLKFVDRALHLGHCSDVLELLLEPRDRPVMAHFELVPDHLPRRLHSLLRRFEPGTLQLEAGVQTLDPQVAARIGRDVDRQRQEQTFAFLADTPIHVHADLVAGLPGETLDGFAAGFDHLWSLRPNEIQLGILKRLRGAPINALAKDFGLVFDPKPPYEILQTSTLDFPTLRRLKRFSQAWDRVVNSGQFRTGAPLLWRGGSTFEPFARFTDWIHGQAGRTHSIALKRWADFLFTYLTTECGLDAEQVGPTLLADYRRGGRRDRPSTLRGFPEPQRDTLGKAPLPRQARHLPP